MYYARVAAKVSAGFGFLYNAMLYCMGLLYVIGSKTLDHREILALTAQVPIADLYEIMHLTSCIIKVIKESYFLTCLQNISA